MKIAEYLKERDVSFDVMDHPETFEASRLAKQLHIPGCRVAKTVLLNADHGYVYIVAVLPADQQIDFELASDALGGSCLTLASEAEISEHCPDCELGVLPPFGSQYGMKTVVDDSLAKVDEIVFEGNRHCEAIRMKFEDFRHVEEPLVAQIAR